MMNEQGHLQEVDHSYIRYANVWEDANILLEALNLQDEEKVLSIASAGDNALALLTTNPEYVVAIDLNKPQLYLTELKKVLIKNNNYEDFLSFLGYKTSNHRWEIYVSIRDALSSEAKAYWDQKKVEIEAGIIFMGKFDKYLKTFATKVLPFIHTKKRVAKLFEEKDENAQELFYKKIWNSFRWRLLFKIFFSKRIMGFFGRDPAFLEQVNVDVGKSIMEKAGSHIQSVHAQKNPILFYCLNGDFGPFLPFYAQETNFLKIKLNIDNLILECGYAQDATKKYGKFDCFNLSNIFEYMDDKIFRDTAIKLLENGNKGARYAYWNLLVDRIMSDKIDSLDMKVDENSWAERDQGFFYKRFILDQKK